MAMVKNDLRDLLYVPMGIYVAVALTLHEAVALVPVAI